MPRRRTKRKEPQQAAAKPRAARPRRLRRSASLLGTVVALGATTIAVLPEEAQTLAPIGEPSPASLAPDLDSIRPAVAGAISAAAELFWTTSALHKRALRRSASAASFTWSPATTDEATSESAPYPLIATTRLAAHTRAGTDLEELLRQRSTPLDLRLTQLPPPYTTSGHRKLEIRLAAVSGRIENSLFEAAQAAGLSEVLTLKLAEIFGWDIDFALDVQAGDTFGAIYEQQYWLGQKIADGPILAAEFSNQGNVYRAIGFRRSDGTIGYYTPDGQNLRRTFLRTPVKFSRVSSRFTESRYHPILKLWRAHTGVDYAAPIGTPIRATASGRITSLGWSGGYGNTVVIEHGNAVRTLYAHLSRFRTNMKAGQRVEQGEVIGYVGKSGLATGPHLHYEFLVDGRHENPLTSAYPGREPIAPEARESFLRLAGEWEARLQLISNRHLATADSR